MQAQEENQDSSWGTHASACIDMIWSALALVGLFAAVALVALYQAGFFSWAATQLPDNQVLQFLFGAGR